jgi:hypothetical protein
MTQGEVEAVLRAPPGNYGSDRRNIQLLLPLDNMLPRLEWRSDEVIVWVWFNQDARVERTHVSIARPSPRPTFFQRVRAWLGW